jgi:hypothetical protein
VDIPVIKRSPAAAPFSFCFSFFIAHFFFTLSSVIVFFILFILFYLIKKKMSLEMYREILLKSGFEQACIFGGALRDLEAAESHSLGAKTIKDVDVRIWTTMEPAEAARCLSARGFGGFLQAPAVGTLNVRFLYRYKDLELDVSFRRPLPGLTPAQDRVRDADLGISAIAMEPSGEILRSEQYRSDVANKTMTVTKHGAGDAERVASYLARMRIKFPQHTIIM